MSQPASALHSSHIRQFDGWCEKTGDRCYNRLVKLPYAASHESLWRDDSAYNAVVVLDYNVHPRTQGRGSAIFFHLIREGATHTDGCIAIASRHMRMILQRCGPKTKMVVWPMFGQ
jgi:L,D-peptidoglycan transpeptidase YkuD (ErfK/YbiS/YcfS/YnhG family)